MLIRFNSGNVKEFDKYMELAGSYLNDQKIIGCATDTIYGIVGLYNPLVAAAIHKIKKRGTDNPFIVLVPQGFDIKALFTVTKDFNNEPPMIPKSMMAIFTCIDKAYNYG